MQPNREPGGAAADGAAAASGGTVPAIALEAVSKAYDGGRTHAVRSIDLAVERGAFMAIIGGSGSGKTTMLKTINRLVTPDAGSIRIDGENVTALPSHLLRRRIGYVFQGIGLFPHMTVAENIGVTPRLLGWSRDAVEARVLELLELVRLPAQSASRLPAELSGGQRQRVGVARALAAKPAIMLLDEPFGALDPVTRDTLGTEYRRLHERMGLTTLMVTHDVLEAVLLADRIGVMHAGELIAQGSPRALLQQPPDERVEALMDMPRRQAERVRDLVQEGPSGQGAAMSAKRSSEPRN